MKTPLTELKHIPALSPNFHHSVWCVDKDSQTQTMISTPYCASHTGNSTGDEGTNWEFSFSNCSKVMKSTAHHCSITLQYFLFLTPQSFWTVTAPSFIVLRLPWNVDILNPLMIIYRHLCSRGDDVFVFNDHDSSHGAALRPSSWSAPLIRL